MQNHPRQGCCTAAQETTANSQLFYYTAEANSYAPIFGANHKLNSKKLVEQISIRIS